LRRAGQDARLKNVPAELPPQLVVKHFLVQGRVQGVGFRWFVHREAAEIGLRGWVRNVPEGHVELVAAGTAGQINELRAALHQGSRGSRVDRVLEHILEDAEADKLKEFQIEGAW
jgi:acylphosphatase